MDLFGHHRWFHNQFPPFFSVLHCLWDLENSRHVHSLMLSSHLFFYLLCRLPFFTDNIREWTGLEFGKSQRAVENREKWKKTCCKITCGAPTTLVVKGLMMMMKMMISLCLARWFWPDLMNRRHVHTTGTAICVSLRWPGGLRVVRLPAGSWHRLPHW